MMIPTDSGSDPAVNRMSIGFVDTADLARSTRNSILSLYGHRSYYHKILDPREGPFAMALELQADYSRVSRIIDDHLEDDLLTVEAASDAADKGFDVIAYTSTKPSDKMEVDTYKPLPPLPQGFELDSSKPMEYIIQIDGPMEYIMQIDGALVRGQIDGPFENA